MYATSIILNELNPLKIFVVKYCFYRSRSDIIPKGIIKYIFFLRFRGNQKCLQAQCSFREIRRSAIFINARTHAAVFYVMKAF